LQTPIVEKEVMSTMSMMTILVRRWTNKFLSRTWT
jgi:hypothetical protein